MKLNHMKLSYSVAEISKLTGLCERKIRGEIKSGRLKSARFGTRVVVRSDAVDEWFEQATTTAK